MRAAPRSTAATCCTDGTRCGFGSTPSPSGCRGPMADGPVDVLTGVRSGIGRITLDRPRAMNALTRPMVGAVDAALHAWRDDPDVEVVVVDGSGERGLCAGGDIKSFHASAIGDG